MMTKDIKKYDFKAGLPIEFEILNLDKMFRMNKNIMTNTHRIGFYHIFWFENSTTTLLVDFQPITIQPDSVLFLNKNTVIRYDNDKNYEGKAIIFTESFFCKSESDTKYMQSNTLFNDFFQFSIIDIKQQQSAYKNLLDLMTAEIQHLNDSYQAEIIHNLLHNFLLLSEREKQKQSISPIKKNADLDILLTYKKLIDKNFKNQKQVNVYAKLLFITDKKLNQVSSKIIGKTAKEMINDRVVLEAKRLLAHTNENVKEIGFTLGFEEPTNFIKYFRKHNRLTPIEFREQFRA